MLCHHRLFNITKHRPLWSKALLDITEDATTVGKILWTTRRTDVKRILDTGNFRVDRSIPEPREGGLSVEARTTIGSLPRHTRFWIKSTLHRDRSVANHLISILWHGPWRHDIRLESLRSRRQRWCIDINRLKLFLILKRTLPPEGWIQREWPRVRRLLTVSRHYFFSLRRRSIVSRRAVTDDVLFGRGRRFRTSAASRQLRGAGESPYCHDRGCAGMIILVDPSPASVDGDACVLVEPHTVPERDVGVSRSRSVIDRDDPFLVEWDDPSTVVLVGL